MEKRFFELREMGDERRFQGVAIPYNEKTRIGHFEEIFLPKSLATGGEIRLNFQHDRKRPLCVNKEGGGLILTDGPDAMRAEIDLPNTGDGKDARELIKRGVITGLSVEFRAVVDEWRGNSRTIHKAELLGLALVDRPQYAGATLEEIRECAPWFEERAKGDALWLYYQ